MRRDIIVIGGSAGCLDALQTILQSLPRDFAGSLFVVVHLPADHVSHLDKVLDRDSELPVRKASDGEPIQPGRVYVARPDHHLTLENGRVHIPRGPRENRHRPAIDPLFRTAAREYGPRVVGVLLSGMLDDGSAGIRAVRNRRGVAIIQDPEDAKWDQMPRRALRYAGADHILPANKIGPKLAELIADEGVEAMPNQGRSPAQARAQGDDPEKNLEAADANEGEGTPSVFACPECHGVLWELKQDELVRFRCRVGHSYGPQSLFKEFSQTAEAALWAAMRALEEKSAMQRRLADSMGGMEAIAGRLREQSASDDANAKVIREIIFQRDEQLEEEEPPQPMAS